MSGGSIKFPHAASNKESQMSDNNADQYAPDMQSTLRPEGCVHMSSAHQSDLNQKEK